MFQQIALSTSQQHKTQRPNTCGFCGESGCTWRKCPHKLQYVSVVRSMRVNDNNNKLILVLVLSMHTCVQDGEHAYCRRTGRQDQSRKLRQMLEGHFRAPTNHAFSSSKLISVCTLYQNFSIIIPKATCLFIASYYCLDVCRHVVIREWARGQLTQQVVCV